MGKIICADSRCIHNKNHKCTAKEINLSSNSIMTLWEGRKDFNTCNTYEESELYKKFRENFDKIIGDKE